MTFRILEKKNIARYVTNVLVVCDKHEFDLISNKDTTYGVILKLKEDSQAKRKVIENISRNYRRIETEYSKLLAKYKAFFKKTECKLMTKMKPLRKRTRILLVH